MSAASRYNVVNILSRSGYIPSPEIWEQVREESLFALDCDVDKEWRLACRLWSDASFGADQLPDQYYMEALAVAITFTGSKLTNGKAEVACVMLALCVAYLQSDQWLSFADNIVIAFLLTLPLSIEDAVVQEIEGSIINCDFLDEGIRTNRLVSAYVRFREFGRDCGVIHFLDSIPSELQQTQPLSGGKNIARVFAHRIQSTIVTWSEHSHGYRPDIWS